MKRLLILASAALSVGLVAFGVAYLLERTARPTEVQMVGFVAVLQCNALRGFVAEQSDGAYVGFNMSKDDALALMKKFPNAKLMLVQIPCAPPEKESAEPDTKPSVERPTIPTITWSKR